MSRNFLKLAALLLTLSLFAGCGAAGQGGGTAAESSPEGTASPAKTVGASQAADHVFSISCDADGGMNPIKAASSTNMEFWSLMYDPVFTVGEDFTVSSEVVTSQKTDDNVWWTFTVDTSIPFTDGSTLTAYDVAYSIQQAKSSAYYSGRLSAVYAASAVSNDTLAVSANYPDSQLPALLEIPIIKNGSASAAVPPGTGPYRLSDDGSSLVLFTANRHASGMPVDTIYLRTLSDMTQRISDFDKSLVDVVTNDPTGMYDLGYGSAGEAKYYNTTNLNYLGFNMQSQFFSSAARRAAMTYAVDRSGIVTDFMAGGGLATTVPILPESSLYDVKFASQYAYSLQKCRAALESADVSDHDGDGQMEYMVTGIAVELNLDFIVDSASAVKVEAARKIADDLNSIGVKTTLRELGWDDYLKALQDGSYDMYYGEVRMTPDWNLAYLFQSGDMDYARCTDAKFSALYAAYLAAGDDARYEAYQEACKYLVENGGIVPICFERRQVLTHGAVTGLAPTQYDIYNKFSEWKIDLS